MWPAWFERLEALFVAVAFAEAGEFETARQIASTEASESKVPRETVLDLPSVADVQP